MLIAIDETTTLELTATRHADGLFHAVDSNRKHLSEFLPWVNNMQSVDDLTNYIKHCETLYQQNREVSFVIMYNEVAVGRVGLHYIDLKNKHASMGYWLTKNTEGKGIITRSCKALINFGFKELNLNRIEIRAAVENLRSQAIPQKLNFKREGIARQAEWVNNGFVDLMVYSLLKEEM